MSGCNKRDCLSTCCDNFNYKLNDVNNRLHELEGYMKMEDRITGSDVLNRLSELEKHTAEIDKYECQNRHLIDVLDKRVKELETKLDIAEKCLCETRYQFISQLGNDKKPHKCPVCDGKCWIVVSLGGQQVRDHCVVCKFTGVVWG